MLTELIASPSAICDSRKRLPLSSFSVRIRKEHQSFPTETIITNTMAFVTPIHNPILTAAGRRSTAVCRNSPKQTPTMKKVRRNAADEEDNAVDVFGGANVSQDELLAAALGEVGEDVSAPVPKPKKKKKARKGTVMDEDENAVDIFGGAGMSQEKLLADALGDGPTHNDINGAASTPKKEKKGKGKKKLQARDNAVDVFEGNGMSQEELLAEALGGTGPPEPVPSAQSKGGKKKKKRGKSAIDEEDNAVDVFGGAGMSQEDLLAEAMGETKSPGTVDDAVDTVEAFQADNSEPDEDKLVAEEEDPLDDFEPDAEVVSEFENIGDEFQAFTAVGRREKSKSRRGERNQTESRLSDPKRATFGSGGEKFTSVRLEDVTVVFRNTTVLNGVTWGVRTGERVGLIGENGCGKTTQLRLIAGLLESNEGEVIRSSTKTKASFLRQEFVDELDPTRTLREEFMSAFTEEGKLLADYKQCEDDIAGAGEDLEKLEVLLNRLEELREKCEQMDAWILDSRIDRVMPGLGFIDEDNDKLVASFSGGWKVRIGLGKVLLQDPDLLLLDEPSNHLDSESVEWLEAYLQTCKLPMVVVSHDREFLDRVCTKIVEIESGEAFEYPGNYTRFSQLKKEQRKAWEAAYERQQKFVKEQENYIKRSRRSPARSSQVKSREKMLLRMERTGQMVRRPPRQGKPLIFRFPSAPRSGRDCIIVDELTHGYGEQTLFKDASIAIERGDRIALIGPNGSGKSTLLRLITGKEEPECGTVECEKLTNITLAYYEQNQADALELDVTVLETLKRAAPSDMCYEEIRALLGKFLFKGDSVNKKVAALSGGEKARLALAKIMLEPSNVLVLDEPGNHLSISAKEMLEEALQHFDGTLLLVSHDRYLISQVATQILAVEDQQLVLYDGDYKSYMEKDQELKERLQARFIPGVAEIKSAPKFVIEEPIEVIGKKQKRKRNFGGSGVSSGRTKEMNAKRWSK